MKTFYIQLSDDNTITDVISYEVEGYIPVELETPLPAGINSGAYSFVNNSVVRKQLTSTEVETFVNLLTDEQKEKLKTMIN